MPWQGAQYHRSNRHGPAIRRNLNDLSSLRHGSGTVVHINQVSKFSKVEVAIDGAAGTRSVNLCTTRWRLPGLVEKGVCYINELNEIVMLKEPKSWKAIQRISDEAIRNRWNEACDAEIHGLKGANVYKLVNASRPSRVRCIPLVRVFKIKQARACEEIGRFKAAKGGPSESKARGSVLPVCASLQVPAPCHFGVLQQRWLIRKTNPC